MSDYCMKRTNQLWLAVILAVTLIVHLPSVRNGFVTFDDPQYVLENPYIRGFTAENLKAVFTTDANDLGNYHPLTLLSYTQNYSLAELDPVSWHWTNILLHLVNTLLVFHLVFMLFTRLGTGHRQLAGSFAALLFAVHPLHVESVAWISGRKDLLYTLFYLLSLLSYLRYLERPGFRHYFISLVFFLFSLLSKGMAVTLALSVIAIDYLFRRDLLSRRVILEKIPFLILALLFGIIAIVVQQAQGATEIVKSGLGDRLVFASYGFTQYLIKFAVPYKLCGYYPYPDLKSAVIPPAWYLAVIPALLTLTVLIYFAVIRPDRRIVFGMVFFMVNVILVLQIYPVGSAVMADRYTYLSSIGVFFLMALGVGELLVRAQRYRKLLLAVLILYLAGLSVISVRRFPAWKDSYSFWQDVTRKYPHFFPAMNNLGEFYENDGKTEEALHMFTASIKAHEENPNAYFHRGSILGKAGKYPEAISDLTAAIKYSPGFTQAYVNRAIARAMHQDYQGALADLDTVIGREKTESALFNRGVLKNQLQDHLSAVADFQEAANLNPACLRCYYSMGLAYYKAKMYPEAVKSFSVCLQMNPSYGYAFYHRGLSYLEWMKPDSACSDLRYAVRLGIREAVPVFEGNCSK
jgi:Tfp pilus assembly protein PilF